MQQINLSDQVYAQVKRRADAAGYENVDDYVGLVLSDDEHSNTPNLDHLFTPERLAIIDNSLAAVKAGKSYTPAQVREHLKKRFEA